MLPLLVTIAFASLLRNRRRTLLTAGAVAAGACGAFLFQGYVTQSYENLAATFAREEGHVQVARSDWFGAARPQQRLASVTSLDGIRSALVADPRAAGLVRGATLRRSFQGLVSTGELTAPFSGTAVEPEGDKALRGGAFATQKGTDLTGGAEAEVVLGPTLATRIAARPGDWISLLVTTDAGRTGAVDARVVGIASTRGKDTDRFFLRMNLSAALALLESDRADSLAIGLTDTRHTDQALALVAAHLAPELAAKSWESLAEYYASVRNLYERIFVAVQGLLLLLVLASVANTVVMSVLERGAEIGMLRAVGATRAQVAGLFLAEGLLTGLAGGLAGIGLGVLLALLVKLLGGIPMPPPPNFAEGYRMNFAIDWTGGLSIMTLSLISTIVAAAWPSRRAARQNIARALGGLASLTLVVGLGLAAGRAEAAGLTAPALLKAVDKHRDLPDRGWETEITFTSFKDGAKQDSMRFKVSGFDGSSLAYCVSDAPGKRMAVLSKGKGMWMQREGMRKAIRVSPSQRLIGSAANADVITVQYGIDYEATSLKAAGDGGKYLLTLTPKAGNESAAYGKIRIVATADGVISAGEYYAVSGKLLKTARFTYGNGGRRGLVGASIEDALHPGESTKVDYAKIIPSPFDDAFFSAHNILGSAKKLER